MKYLIVYAHPNPASFNNAILATISEELKKSNKNFEVRDLYKLHFNPSSLTKENKTLIPCSSNSCHFTLSANLAPIAKARIS
ncbi:MAG: NAD(P)H-dependent oxidoreductase [Thermodesulfovibrionales bacterium]